MRAVVVLCSLAAAVLAAGFAATYLPDHFRKPDVQEMRSHRLSGISEERLRALHREAAADVQQRKLDAEKERESSRAKLSADLTECRQSMNDPAFKARHPDGCNGLPLMLLDDHVAFRIPSADEAFEKIIIGPCVFAQSVYEARQMGCLPARP